MGVAEDTKIILSITKAYRDSAGLLMDEALARVAAGTMSGSEFQDFRASCYEPILGAAINLRNRYDAALGEALATHIADIKTESKNLKSALKRVNNVEKVIGFAAKVLAAIVSIGAFIGGPTPESGATALSAIGAAATAVPARE